MSVEDIVLVMGTAMIVSLVALEVDFYFKTLSEWEKLIKKRNELELDIQIIDTIILTLITYTDNYNEIITKIEDVKEGKLKEISMCEEAMEAYRYGGFITLYNFKQFVQKSMKGIL